MPVVCTHLRKPASEDQNGSMGPGTRCAIKTLTFASEKGGMPDGEARHEAEIHLGEGFPLCVEGGLETSRFPKR